MGFTLMDFIQLTSGLPSKGEKISFKINGNDIEDAIVCKDESGWHINLRSVDSINA